MDEELLVTVVGGVSEDDVTALNGLAMWASRNNLSWSPP